MPAQKPSSSSEEQHEEDADVDLQRNSQNENDDVQPQAQESGEEEVEEEDDGESSSSSSSSSSSYSDDGDEFVYVKLADIRKDVQCPICLGIIRKTRKVMECLHRFCRECIDKSMRLGNNECPACRTHCASRRSLRDDPNFDALIALLYPDIDKYEAEEMAFHEEEKARNQQIQASIAQTSRRQLEALGKKRASAKATANAFLRRSQGTPRNLRGRSRKSAEPQVSDDEVDSDDNDNGGSSSSSDDEPFTEVAPKRYKRWSGGQSSVPSSNANGRSDDNETKGTRKSVGASVPEIPSWGGAGFRSHTRSKGAKNNQFYRLINHLQKSPLNYDKLEIHLKLVSLDEQNIPHMQNSNVCCKPTMSTTNICQYVALEKGLQASEIELLLVKGERSDLNPSGTSRIPPAEEPGPIAINPWRYELQLLDGNQILLDLAKTSPQNNLTIVYKKKFHS